MSKKKSGLLIAFGAMLGGAVAAGISYYLKLKSFNDELDQDFHEYEEEETPSEETEEKTEPAPERTYITINSGKDTNAADDSVKKEETKDSEETACPEPTDEKDSVKEENVPEEKTSSVVVEDDTVKEKPNDTKSSPLHGAIGSPERKKPQFLNRGTGGGDGSAPEHGSPDSADIL